MAEQHTIVVCDVGAVVDPDLSTVAVLARLALAVHRLGGELRLEGVSDELAELLAFTGLGTCSGVSAFGPEEPWSQQVWESPMSSRTPRRRTGKDVAEEDSP